MPPGSQSEIWVARRKLAMEVTPLCLASAKKLKTAKFGVIVDPEFSVTQHINGICHLYAALSIFKTGRIRHKGGSNATFVFVRSILFRGICF